MPSKKGWIVTISGDRPIEEVEKDLAKAGFSVGQVLKEVGSITGVGDDNLESKLRAIRGVADVTPDTPIDIGPPGSPNTW
jgi:hypothetical protein